MRILISVDIEGIGGVESQSQLNQQTIPEYRKSCELMTGETNAAVMACVAAGCEKIYVLDGHAQSKNIIRENLSKDCILLERSQALTMMTGVEKDIDAVLFIGYHGMAGKPESFCAHTNSTKLVKSLTINNQEASEGITNAIIGKHYNAKVIFISGTDKGVSELKKEIPSIHSFVNLASISSTEAISVAVPENLEKIKQEIISAISNFDKIGFISLSTKNLEFSVELKEKFPLASLHQSEISNKGEKITFFAEDIVQGYAKYREILDIVKQKN